MLTKTEKENISLRNKNFGNNQNYIISEKIKKEIIKAHIINNKFAFIGKILDKMNINKESDLILFIPFILLISIFLSSIFPDKFMSYILYIFIAMVIVSLLLFIYWIGNMLTKNFLKIYYKFLLPFMFIFIALSYISQNGFSTIDDFYFLL